MSTLAVDNRVASYPYVGDEGSSDTAFRYGNVLAPSLVKASGVAFVSCIPTAGVVRP